MKIVSRHPFLCKTRNINLNFPAAASRRSLSRVSVPVWLMITWKLLHLCALFLLSCCEYSFSRILWHADNVRWIFILFSSLLLVNLCLLGFYPYVFLGLVMLSFHLAIPLMVMVWELAVGEWFRIFVELA